MISLPKNACQCATCKDMCKHPCWPTPRQAKRLIDAGYGKRLRADYWAGDGTGGEDILILSPALAGKEGDYKPSWPSEKGRSCTFFVDGLCQLHGEGLKPLEGRHAHHSQTVSGSKDIHEKIALKWNTEPAQELAEKWTEEFMVEQPDTSSAPFNPFRSIFS